MKKKPYKPYNGHLLEVLVYARQLIVDAWTKKCEARDRHGQMTGATSGRAHAYCAIGSLRKAQWDLNLDFDYHAEDILKKFIPVWYGQKSVPHFNDDPKTTKDDIVKLFDKAIEKAAK